jgi:peptide/nickel transport system substrate-binding protein
LGPDEGAVSQTVQSVTPEGTEWIVIRTSQPEGFLLSDISIGNFQIPGRPHIGTGPYMVVSDTPPIQLKAFDAYRGGRPAIDELRITDYSTQRQAWAAMMRGESDVLYEVSTESVDFVKAESTIQSHSFLRAYYHALVFNLTLPKFSSPTVRRALNSAVDRQQVVSLSLRKQGVPADSPIWPYHFGFSANQPAYKYDPALAVKLLDEAGLTANAAHTSDDMPSRLRFVCLVPSTDQSLQRVALLLQKQLYAVGVDMQVELLPLKQLRGRVGSGNFEAVLSEFAATRGLGFVYSIWHSPPPGVPTGLNFHYRAADAALDRLRAARDEAAIKSAIAELQRTLHDDPPAVFLDWSQSSRALRRSIAVPKEASPDVIGSISQWKPAASRGAGQ